MFDERRGLNLSSDRELESIYGTINAKDELDTAGARFCSDVIISMTSYGHRVEKRNSRLYERNGTEAMDFMHCLFFDSRRAKLEVFYSIVVEKLKEKYCEILVLKKDEEIEEEREEEKSVARQINDDDMKERLEDIMRRNAHMNRKRPLENDGIKKNHVVYVLKEVQGLLEKKSCERALTEEMLIGSMTRRWKKMEEICSGNVTNVDLESKIFMTKVKKQLRNEKKMLKMGSIAEEDYETARYIILCSIAMEEEISKRAGEMSDPFKFKNMPLYLSLLLEELENTTFNVLNSTYVMRDFIRAAMLYYVNGMVKQNVMTKFYSHARYAK